MEPRLVASAFSHTYVSGQKKIDIPQACVAVIPGEEVGLNNFYMYYIYLTSTLVATAETEIERLPVQAPCKGFTSIAFFISLHSSQVRTFKDFHLTMKKLTLEEVTRARS